MKIKLSALWVALLFMYTYGDMQGFYTQGNIEQLMSGEIEGIQITEGFLIVMAIWMAIPVVMILMSLTLKANVNRWANIIIGIVSFFAAVGSSFVGGFSVRYTIQVIVEVVFVALIVWYAWKWPKQERVEVTP